MSNNIHPTAIIDENVKIGEGTKVWHWSHLSPGANIGKNCTLGQNTYIGNNVQIGHGCKIQNNVSIYESVTLEEEVFCGPSVVFTNVKNPRSEVNRKDEYKETLVRRGASIGANATIVCGVTLGEYSFIAAGAVITKDTQPFSLMAGVPAKRIGWMDQDGNKVQEQPTTKI
jgi:UDP-2-acetamido-3-amino-2,3-dideoxy-glucuronate N-acetyltransferase